MRTYVPEDNPLLIPFLKVTGAGNDFVLCDNWEAWLPDVHRGDLARVVCDRHFGIGADGLLILEKDKSAHFSMSYFNADGSSGGMCGNGGRCIARVAWLRGYAPLEMNFRALDHIYHATIASNSVKLRMKQPTGYRLEQIDAEAATVEAYFIDTGSPHVCLFSDDLSKVDVEKVGRLVRYHRKFQPQGVNVDFVQVESPSHIRLRTYERGVEQETLACGTGAVAAAAVSAILGHVITSTRVTVRSGDTMLVTFEKGVMNPILEGDARILFKGSFLYDRILKRIEANLCQDHVT